MARSIRHRKSGRTRPGGLRILGIVGGALGGLLIVIGVLLALNWPTASLESSYTSLAEVSTSGATQPIEHLSAIANGKPIAVKLEGSSVLPSHKLPTGVPFTVSVTLGRPSWISWISGRQTTLTFKGTTPRAKLLDPVAIPASGQAVQSDFSNPVSVVAYSYHSSTKYVKLDRASTHVSLPGATSAAAGSLQVAAVPDPWETLPASSNMVFFRASGTTPEAVINPDLTNLEPESTITITLSVPVAKAFGAKLPTIAPTIQGSDPVKGSWAEPTPYTLTFTPTAGDFWPTETFTMTTPAPIALVSPTGALGTTGATFSLSGGPIPTLRLQELLAQLGYLPVSFSSPTTVPNTEAAQIQALANPPQGSFNWKWTMPTQLTSLWSAGNANVITEGAAMAFEDFNSLNYNNKLANPLLFPTLIQDVIHNKVDPHPYAWIQVQKQRPETLYLWVNGQVVLTSPANTGIAGLKTTNGTFPIYLRFKENYMSGTNPNGTHYHDLVHWINYFLGSEAVHGFPRAAYGFPQSLGCVELPIPTAGVVYPQVHIGTLVTVMPS
ncbi:L,D-transpeptidase [Ferrimicrobium sp.]|uniref:L,D-transpeptidase n=1 Tax=Ferrimicrobium sp. TaxID=2926050 RepID=UPI002638C145|nr:L,D-transpeptidase [Ferrimicrobium sp.]